MLTNTTTVTWDDTTGRRWDLRDVSSGVWMGLQAQGLVIPPVQRHTSELHNASGSWWRSQRVNERSVVIEIHIAAPTPQAWAELHEQWWAGMDPTTTGTLTVQAPGRPARALTLRPVWDGAHAEEHDPSMAMHAVYAMEWVAENPFFAGEVVVASATSDTIKPYLSVEERPESLWISGGVGQAALTNAGDAPTWPTWVLTGPINQTVTLKIGENTITIPHVTLAAGKTMRVETDPVNSGLFDHNGNRLPNTATSFVIAPLPPGVTQVTADIGLSGTAQITYRAQFWRGW